jgi:hypothetical protein
VDKRIVRQCAKTIGTPAFGIPRAAPEEHLNVGIGESRALMTSPTILNKAYRGLVNQVCLMITTAAMGVR